MSAGSGLAAAALLGILALLGHSRAAGQGWVVEASAGSAEYDAVAGEVGTRSAILAVRNDDSPWLYLAAGAPLDSAGIPWAAGGAGGRVSTLLRRLEAGLDVGANAYAYRAEALGGTGAGLTLAGLPFVAFSAGDARVELRSGLLRHTSAFGGVSEHRTVHDSGFRGWVSLASGMRLSGEGRLVRAEEGSYPFGGAGAEVPVGRGVAWIRAGRWLSDELDDPAWGIGIRLDLARRFTLSAAFEQEPDDPLYWNGARRGWTIGLSRALGRASSASAAAPIPLTLRPESGTVLFRIPLSEAREAPSVAGDFNDWEAVPMRRGDGYWEVAIPIAPGVYHYVFRSADGRWFVPDSIPHRVDDGFGSVNAVLIVTGP